MPDSFADTLPSASTPSEIATAVTPHDTQSLPLVTKYLYVGNGGRITLRARDSNADVVFENVPSGGYIFVRVSHVRATGTTATAIVACA